MTAINFPTTSTNGTVFSAGERTWTWVGNETGFWKATSTTLGYTGSVGYTGSRGVAGPSGSATNPWFSTSTNYTAIDGDRIILNNSFGSFSITLPAIATVGTYIQLTDGNDLSNGYPVTVLRNGNTIEGATNDISLDLKGSTFEFIYNGSTWQVTATGGPKGVIGYTGSIGANTITLQQPGNLVLFTGTARWYAPFACNITSITPRVRVAPDAVISINLVKNGSAISNVNIASNATSGTSDTIGYALALGDYLTVNVLSVGSNLNPGVDLYLQLVYQPI
jgi:hypothetical protein